MIHTQARTTRAIATAGCPPSFPPRRKMIWRKGVRKEGREGRWVGGWVGGWVGEILKEGGREMALVLVLLSCVRARTVRSQRRLPRPPTCSRLRRSRAHIASALALWREKYGRVRGRCEGNCRAFARCALTAPREVHGALRNDTAIHQPPPLISSSLPLFLLPASILLIFLFFAQARVAASTSHAHEPIQCKDAESFRSCLTAGWHARHLEQRVAGCCRSSSSSCWSGSWASRGSRRHTTPERR
jgi:hypothetical protein